MQTWRDLLSEPENSPWHGLLLKKSRLEAERAVREFAALALVDDVIWLKADIPAPERLPPVMRLFDSHFPLTRRRWSSVRESDIHALLFKPKP